MQKSSVEIMRAFVGLRELAGHSRDLARRLNALAAGYDTRCKFVFDAIRQLMTLRCLRRSAFEPGLRRAPRLRNGRASRGAHAV